MSTFCPFPLHFYGQSNEQHLDFSFHAKQFAMWIVSLSQWSWHCDIASMLTSIESRYLHWSVYKMACDFPLPRHLLILPASNRIILVLERVAKDSFVVLVTDVRYFPVNIFCDRTETMILTVRNNSSSFATNSFSFVIVKVLLMRYPTKNYAWQVRIYVEVRNIQKCTSLRHRSWTLWIKWSSMLARASAAEKKLIIDSHLSLV